MSRYEEAGFANRKEYLVNLADEFGVNVSEVLYLASVLGPGEDFDGLITSIEDELC